MSEINNEADLNENFEEVMSDAEVITVPIDDTLSNSGEAADAAAVGAALALKADKSEVATITVNGQGPDLQGHIIVNGTQIELSGSDDTTLTEAIEEAAGRTGADIPVNDSQGAMSVTQAISAAASRTAQEIRMSSAEGAATISGKIATMDQATADVQTQIQGISARTGADIPMSSTDSTKVADAIGERLKSVNGILGDADGDVYVDQVPFADNLRSSLSQNVIGTFTLRTSGGDASIEDGDAWLTGIRGNRIHNGYVPESLNMSVNMVDREQGEDTIDATIDRDVFVAYVATSGTTVLSYTSSWSQNPTLYGVTVTGTPKNGDSITIVYVKENRGTIVQATPATFVATGWNLYSDTLGYAKVVKYSDTYGYRVEGTYTSLAFSTTVDGTQTPVTVVDGNFTIPASGYVFVTGGNSSSTEIYMTWSDWTDSEDHPDFEAYTDKVIDLSTVMAEKFPYGLLRAGDIRDEINLNAGLAISNVMRMDYNAENIAYAEESGRVYEYDTNYIYIERETAVTANIELDGGYPAFDHGIEYFTGTVVPVYAVVLYGNNLKNKLERDVLTISEQTLTEAQQEQVKANLGISNTQVSDEFKAGDSFSFSGWTWYGAGGSSGVGFVYVTLPKVIGNDVTSVTYTKTGSGGQGLKQDGSWLSNPSVTGVEAFADNHVTLRITQSSISNNQTFTALLTDFTLTFA